MKRSLSTDSSDNSRSGLNPESILNKLRVFCANYFFETDSDKKARHQNILVEYLKPRIEKLCDKLNAVLDNEDSLVDITSPAYVLGDIHGNVFDLWYYEQRLWGSGQTKSNCKFVFLGDFVDRGPHSVEVVAYLFALKLLEPNRFYLIRGNHETISCNKNYTLEGECIKKFGAKQGKNIYKKLNDAFSRFPLALTIDRTVFCCHGGVPCTYPTLEKIRQISKPLISPHETSRTAYELLWNDPVESMTSYSRKGRKEKLKRERTEFIFNRARNTGKYFTNLAVNKFLKKNKLEFIIRAHECEPKGYKFHANGKVVTVFSSSAYDGNNTTACAEVTKSTIRIVILKDPRRRRDRKIYSEETMRNV